VEHIGPEIGISEASFSNAAGLSRLSSLAAKAHPRSYLNCLNTIRLL
jgi:hypothetical protein